MEGDACAIDPHSMFWNKVVPTKMGFIAWEAWLGKVLTTLQLK